MLRRAQPGLEPFVAQVVGRTCKDGIPEHIKVRWYYRYEALRSDIEVVLFSRQGMQGFMKVKSSMLPAGQAMLLKKRSCQSIFLQMKYSTRQRQMSDL